MKRLIQGIPISERSHALIAAACGISEDELEFCEMIQQLSNEERRELRAEWEKIPGVRLPRNLYYNYQTQEWI